MPELEFRVVSAEALKYAATPSIAFGLEVKNSGIEAVKSITLNTQIRIATRERHYSEPEQGALASVFGTPDSWGRSLSSMLWTHAVTVIPPFNGATRVEIPVACTYDLDVVQAKYFHALENGDVPLDFLFSGSVFYSNGQGLQIVQIPWDREARFRLPVSVWKEMMDHYFPNAAWLRIHRSLFERLYDFKSRESLPTWEDVLERLLSDNEERRT